MSNTPTIVWFQRDLRVTDNPALAAAIEAGGPVIPLFIRPDTVEPDARTPGAASRWWLHHSLAALSKDVGTLGSRLILRIGEPAAVLEQLVRETGARTVCWNRGHTPAEAALGDRTKARLEERGAAVRTFNASLLIEPWDITSRSGDPYKVFTPFWRACQAGPDPPEPMAAPTRLPRPKRWPDSVGLDDLGFLPKRDWAGGIRAAWQPGEKAALFRLTAFLDDGLRDYATARDRLDQHGTSRLSPHLHFGEIGPRQVWHAVIQRRRRYRRKESIASAEAFLAELGWREFAHHVLYHFPHTLDQPLRPEFERFPWRDDATRLRAWQRGRTGYPVVDAAMNELWTTGWMHNRARMIVASFLVKDLLIPWQQGARWFEDTLVDADLANNALGWQWAAGCGADAAPYFRIFNPVTQGRRFDPDGEYVRRWLPILAGLPHRYLHEPWAAPADTLKAAGVMIGQDYPAPIVDHGDARKAALAAFDRVRRRG